jgi:hypothetical protein
MNQSLPLAADARERFLLEIKAVVPAERIAEAHFFPPMRQGPIETGVAVIAAMPDASTPQPETPYADEKPVSEQRHVIYSARYRWTRKGPERGKWECEIVAEADAPLLTAEKVVEGVRHRTGEAFECEKLEGDAVRALIAEAERRWQTTP